MKNFLKTFLAVIGNSSIIGVHILFGFIEAIIDYSAGEKKAAIFSIFSHAGFGILATLTYLQYGLFWSLAISTIMHMSYNKVMVTI